MYLSYSFRRVNFSLEHLSAASPYYSHFRRCVDMSYPTSKGELKFQAQQIDTHFPQYSNYDRVKELVREFLTTIMKSGYVYVINCLQELWELHKREFSK